MAANEVHKDDVGTVLEVTIMDGDDVVDVSGATSKKIILQAPSMSGSVSKDADFVTDGSDGKIKYTTVADDLNETGDWAIQGKVTSASGTWCTDIGSFKVYENL